MAGTWQGSRKSDKYDALVGLGRVNELVAELDVGGQNDETATLGERENPTIGLPTQTFVSDVSGFEIRGAK